LTISEKQSQSSKTSKPQVLFGVLSTYEREGWIHPTILSYFCDYPFLTGTGLRVVPIHNFKPAAAGRNVFCKQAKDTNCDWVCMIDNDMAIPGNLLDAVTNAPEDADIICPQFYMWNQQELTLTLCWGIDTISDGKAQFQPGYHELTKCGTGVIFIRRKVFEAMQYPYFEYVWNADNGVYGTEDIAFCTKAVKLGFKIYGTTEVRVGHYHSVEIGSLWAWKEKVEKTLDSVENKLVLSPKKDAGCSPVRSASDSVPVEA
jgi:hypothetical protein